MLYVRHSPASREEALSFYLLSGACFPSGGGDLDRWQASSQCNNMRISSLPEFIAAGISFKAELITLHFQRRHLVAASLERGKQVRCLFGSSADCLLAELIFNQLFAFTGKNGESDSGAWLETSLMLSSNVVVRPSGASLATPPPPPTPLLPLPLPGFPRCSLLKGSQLTQRTGYDCTPRGHISGSFSVIWRITDDSGRSSARAIT